MLSHYAFFSIIALSCFSSMFFFNKSNIKISLFLLFITALVLRLFFINTDNYLHDWDERFHAIVAKNMISFPFQPMLRVNLVLENYDFTAWCCNHIWLHKQPLFLWQIALSMKCFGVNTFALRLPSALMGALLIFPTYRIAKLIFNSNVGYYAAFLLTFAFYQIELISGAMGMDHNDMAFLFYITLSLWAYFEYNNKADFKWLILVGLFSGAAILCKWLVGLLVYFGWGLHILLNYKNVDFKQQVKSMFISIFVTGITFLPWQIYTSIYFPKESTYERAYNTKHIFEAVEGHTGTVFYYLQNLGLNYSSELILFILLGIIFLFQERSTKKIIFLSYIAVIYVFFSIIVKSKLPSYVYLISPLVYILIAYAIDNLFVNRLEISNKVKQISIFSILIFCALFTLQPTKLIESHFSSLEIEKKRNNTSIYKQLNELVPKDYTVFNCKSFEDTEAMFFSDRNVYHWYMNEKEYQDLKQKGIKIAAFKNHTNQQLPSYLSNDKDVLIIDKELK